MGLRSRNWMERRQTQPRQTDTNGSDGQAEAQQAETRNSTSLTSVDSATPQSTSNEVVVQEVFVTTFTTQSAIAVPSSSSPTLDPGSAPSQDESGQIISTAILTPSPASQGSSDSPVSATLAEQVRQTPTQEVAESTTLEEQPSSGGRRNGGPLDGPSSALDTPLQSTTTSPPTRETTDEPQISALAAVGESTQGILIDSSFTPSVPTSGDLANPLSTLSFADSTFAITADPSSLPTIASGANGDSDTLIKSDITAATSAPNSSVPDDAGTSPAPSVSPIPLQDNPPTTTPVKGIVVAGSIGKFWDA